MKFYSLWRLALAFVLSLGLMSLDLRAEGPVETGIYAVQGVAADVTGKDATAAKNQALMDVQVKAFFILVERLGSPKIAKTLSSMKLKDIAPYLRSLSIEQESTAPGRYIGKFTVRFQPDKMQQLLSSYGVAAPLGQAPAIVVIPVWKGAGEPLLWEDNLWRQAWLDLGAEQAVVPLIVPLGDLEDTDNLTASDALAGDPVRLENIRRRYNAGGVLVAEAGSAKNNGIRAAVIGTTGQGEVKFEKTYTSDTATLEASAALAVKRIQALLVAQYRQGETATAAEFEEPGSAPSQSLAVAVPFESPSQWNSIRSRILSTPNVTGVDVSSLDASGAVIRLSFTDTIQVLEANMQNSGLIFTQMAGTWVIQPM